MKARMTNPALVLPDAVTALQALGNAADGGGLPARTTHLVHLRASQINGCSVCVDMHPRLAKKDGETDKRLFAVAAWREAPYFTDGERAALALTGGGDPARGPARPGVRRRLGRGRPPLRRAATGGADPADLADQRVEPARRDGRAGGRRAVVTTGVALRQIFWNDSR